MIERYSVRELTAIWSDEHKFQTWLRVEIAVVQAWGEEGVIPAADVAAINSKATVNVPDVMRYIDETHHDVTAFLRSVADSLGDESRWVHYGLTSNDVWDTATCLQWLDAIDFLSAQVAELREVVTRRALEHRKTICIGRTHGVHAEPTTFGLKLLVWIDELRRHEERLALAREHLAVGQMSGPVGTHASVLEHRSRSSPRRSALSSARRSARPKSPSPKVLRRGHPRCHTSATRNCVSVSVGSHARCAVTRLSALKMSHSGTSAIFHTPERIASSSRTPPVFSVTC
jgi:adenylosuccinate lyase